MVLHLRAQGLGEGEEHPPMLSCVTFTFTPLFKGLDVPTKIGRTFIGAREQFRLDALPVVINDSNGLSVMWSYDKTVSPRTRPVSDPKIGLDLGPAGLVLCCKTRSCYARRHNDFEGNANFSSTIYSFSILCLEHQYCGDQQWRSLT